MTKETTTPAKTLSDDNLPDVGVSYSAAHISGDEDKIREYEAEHDDSCFLVDWRGEFEDLFDDVNSRLTGSPIEPAAPVSGSLVTVARNGQTASAKSFNRVEVMQAMDDVLQGAEEEMRVIAESLCSDTVAVMVKPVSWWRAMDEHFPEEMKNSYVKLADIEVT